MVKMVCLLVLAVVLSLLPLVVWATQHTPAQVMAVAGLSAIGLFICLLSWPRT